MEDRSAIALMLRREKRDELRTSQGWDFFSITRIGTIPWKRSEKPVKMQSLVQILASIGS